MIQIQLSARLGVIRLAYASYCFLVLGLHPAFSAPPAAFRDYRLVLFDDFNTDDLGFAEGGRAQQPNTWYEGVWFSKHHAPRENFVFSASELSLIWKRGQPQPDSSIATFSRNNPHYHAWRYGYFEARMKWQPQPGAWPAFWLIPIQPAINQSQRETGELDIFEGQGTEPHTFFGTIHRWNGARDVENSSPNNHFALARSTDFSQFHTYGLLWLPGRVTWFFDDVPLHTEATYDIFDHQDYFLVLSMQEGSDWKTGDLTGVSAEILTLTVDWVRVWQK